MTNRCRQELTDKLILVKFDFLKMHTSRVPKRSDIFYFSSIIARFTIVLVTKFQDLV